MRICIGLICLTLFILGCKGKEDMHTGTAKKKPVLILAAFGTSVLPAQKALENIDTQYRKAFPNHDIRWALTAQFIINKLRKQGRGTMFARKVNVASLEDVYADLKKEGVTSVTVQSLHVVPGGEYNQVLDTPKRGLRVKYGKPLMYDDASIAELAKNLSPLFAKDGAYTILCGHGNDHHKKYNKYLVDMDQHVRKHYKRVMVATVEGLPGTDKPFADVRKASPKKISFVPLMIVAGDHIMNDVMGEENDSWRKILKLPASIEKGMGENNAVVKMYIERTHAAK